MSVAFCKETKTEEMIKECIIEYMEKPDSERCATCKNFDSEYKCTNFMSCKYAESIEANDGCCMHDS